MWRKAIVSFAWCCLFPAASAAPLMREAPNPGAVPVNQLSVAGNACGPAALLNAFRFGNSAWQRATADITGSTDRQRILTVIREVGMRPSKHLPGHPRWSRRGVSLADLHDMGNEMAAGKFLPLLSEEIFFRGPRETPERLLRRVHDRLETSLAKGLPPIISLRRYVLRGKSEQWQILDAHFVTVVSIPAKLEKGAVSFPVSYIDPWGGKLRQGSVAIPGQSVLAAADGGSSCLEAVFPETSVGKNRVRPGERSALVVSAAIGRW